MTSTTNIPLSVLGLSPIRHGHQPAEALANTVEPARAAEAYGYRRPWISEHHNTTAMASSATAIMIGQVAAATEHIRVGAGGIMLPDHAPYVVAEQFGTLATYHPGRIDLGLGRAPGTDPWTTRPLRRHRPHRGLHPLGAGTGGAPARPHREGDRRSRLRLRERGLPRGGRRTGRRGDPRRQRLPPPPVPRRQRQHSHRPLGGDAQGRTRLTTETTRAVADAIGPHRTGLRISPSNPFGDLNEIDPYGTYTALVRGLAPLDLAYLHHSETGTGLDPAIRGLWPTALIVTPPRPAGTGKEDAVAGASRGAPTSSPSAATTSPTPTSSTAAGPAPPSTKPAPKVSTAAEPTATPTTPP